MSVRPNNPRKDWRFVSSDYVPQLEDTTQAYFARNNERFKTACSLGNVQPTKLQARKYRQKRGKAYRAELEVAA